MNDAPKAIEPDVPDFKNGICPIMTSTQVIPIPKGGNITGMNSQPEFELQQANSFIPCFGKKCQLWSELGGCRMGIVRSG